MMTKYEAFILRAIEWNAIDRAFIEHIFLMWSSGKGTPEFKAYFGKLYGDLVVDSNFGSMPALDDIAALLNMTPVERFVEEELVSPERLAKATISLEKDEGDSDHSQTVPVKLLYSPHDPISPTAGGFVDFVRMALVSLNMPPEYAVEEVRFSKDFAQAKVFRPEIIPQGMMPTVQVIAPSKILLLKQGVMPEEVSDWK